MIHQKFLKLHAIAILAAGLTFSNLAGASAAASAVTTGTQDFTVISHGKAAGTYQAFPDAVRLPNGDIAAVFYAGYGHVSLPRAGWESGGRICMVTSSDEGSTWTEPRVIYDDPRDNRDPHIAVLSDGTLACTFFSLMPKPGTGKGYLRFGTEIIFSRDGGKTWDEKGRVIAPPGWFVSAPVRQLRDGTCILGVYYFGGENERSYGGVILSKDLGKTWSEPVPIGKDQGLDLDAETDVIELKDGRIYAALRSREGNMRYAVSKDGGQSWSAAEDIGFPGHAPHLFRASSGDIILTHRFPQTAMHISHDDAATWQGPFAIDDVKGAYPATVELKDGSFLVIYYTEGKGSHVRVKRWKLTPAGPEFISPAQ